MSKGNRRNANDQYERILLCLEKMEGAEFTLAEIIRTTKIPKNVVGGFLLRNFKRGFLRRTGTPGHSFGVGYKYSVKQMPTLYESKGSVAEAVWKVLKGSKAPLTEAQIRKRANLGRKRLFLNSSIHNVVWRLFRKEAVERLNGEYLLDKEITTRPTLTV